MALTEKQAADRVSAMLDNLGADLSTEQDGDKAIGDYSYPLEFTLRDMGLSAIANATAGAQERAVLNGMQYYAYLRLFRKYASRASQQQGAGASGMHLSLDWSSTAKTLRMHVRECKDSYELSLAALGLAIGEDPDMGGTVSQAVVVERGASSADDAMLRPYDGLPWFVEAEYDI